MLATLADRGKRLIVVAPGRALETEILDALSLVDRRIEDEVPAAPAREDTSRLTAGWMAKWLVGCARRDRRP
jgi:hypothetical protein